MNAPTSLDETIRRAQDILWSALPPGVARTSAVVELKELLWSTQTREALALASDNYLAFALRESRMALADASAWARARRTRPCRRYGQFSTIPRSTLRSAFPTISARTPPSGIIRGADGSGETSPVRLMEMCQLRLRSQTTFRPLLSSQRPPRRTCRHPDGSGRQPMGPHSIWAPFAGAL